MTAAPNNTTPSIRDDLAEWLREHYLPAVTVAIPAETPDVEVKPYRQRLSADLPAGYLVDIRLEQMTRGTTGGNRRSHELSVDLVSAWDDEQSGQLDAMVSVLLDVMTTTSRGLNWSSAVFAIRDEAFPCYRITLTMEEKEAA